MSLIKRIFRRRRNREEQPAGSYVMDIEWERSEELRTDLLGPSQEDVPNPERLEVERWRPSRHLRPPARY